MRLKAGSGGWPQDYTVMREALKKEETLLSLVVAVLGVETTASFVVTAVAAYEEVNSDQFLGVYSMLVEPKELLAYPSDLKGYFRHSYFREFQRFSCHYLCSC